VSFDNILDQIVLHTILNDGRDQLAMAVSLVTLAVKERQENQVIVVSQESRENQDSKVTRE